MKLPLQEITAFDIFIVTTHGTGVTVRETATGQMWCTITSHHTLLKMRAPHSTPRSFDHLALPSPKRPRPMTFGAEDPLKFDSEFKPSYLHTRNKNLRCFPTCFAGGVHMEKSFCGASVRVTLNTSHLSMSQVFLFGEVHGYGEGAYHVGDVVSLERMTQDDSGRFVIGSSARTAAGEQANTCSMGQQQYSFSPGRKWVYASISHDNSFHVYSVYLVVAGRVHQVIVSPKFRVIPIWTEQKRAKKAKLALLAEQQHQQQSEEEKEGEAAAYPAQQSIFAPVVRHAAAVPFMRPNHVVTTSKATTKLSFPYEPLSLPRHNYVHPVAQAQGLHDFYRVLRSIHVNYGPKE